MKYLPILLVLFSCFNCKNKSSNSEVKSLSAEEIIDKSIALSGGDSFNNSIITFDFRAINYKALRLKGKFELSRFQIIESDSISDIITNNGFERRINRTIVKVKDSLAKSYESSVNSVHYFSILPHGLDDKAVNKRLIGEEKIKNKDYFKIEVTFNQEGGGEDFEDVFIYWINKDTYKPDYLAYSYNEDDRKGTRFREAYNERYIKGIRFVDYNNYKSEDLSIKLIDLGKAFDNKSLTLLSKIELENVMVDLINN